MPPDDEVSSMKFAGSTLMVVASSKEEVIDLLRGDVYVESGVWDLEKVRHFAPFLCAMIGMRTDVSLYRRWSGQQRSHSASLEVAEFE